MADIKNETVAALDIGANFIRMIVAEIYSDGTINILDNLHKNTSIGRDTFTNGRIGLEAIYETCNILDGFVNLMRDYGVKSYWAISTSGIREAENREYVLEQIRIRTGIVIEVINNAQERFLVFKALRDKLQKSKSIYEEGAVIVNIGSGGVEVSVYSKGKLKFTEYIKIGSLRLHEILNDLEDKTLNYSGVMKEYVDSKIDSFKKHIESLKVKNFVGLGGGMKLILKKHFNDDNNYVSKEKLLDIYNKVCKMSSEKISDYFDISLNEAKLLLPSAIIIISFLQMTESEGIYFPSVSLRDGMLIDMLSRKFNSKDKKVFDEDIINSVWYIGEKYGIDKEHAKSVQKLAKSIFEQTIKIHKFGKNEQMILEIAAILHDVGRYININERGIQCYNLIHHEEILGLSDKDLNIVANVARYHGEDIPSFSHESYILLNYKDKLIVSKLAAILKLSEALNISHSNKINDVEIKVDNRYAYFMLNSYADCTLEIWNFEIHAEFFEEVMGVKPIIKHNNR